MQNYEGDVETYVLNNLIGKREECVELPTAATIQQYHNSNIQIVGI